MAQDKNFFRKAFDALIEGRERQAQRYVARLEREHGRGEGPFTKR